jgi:flagellar hook protein FlgE
MMRSLYAAVSGLKNSQTYMDVIGNNIANVNTVGYKSSSVTFQDMLSQTLQGASGASGTKGGTNPMQVGLGVSLASISTNFSDGSTQSTGVANDLAISGQGFFVVGTAQNQMYTRDGSFTTDSQGNFLTSSGQKVLGWQANSSGAVDTSQPITGLQIPVGSSMPAKVSSTITLTGNLNGSATALDTATVLSDANTALTDATTLQTAAGALKGAYAPLTATTQGLVNQAKLDADTAVTKATAAQTAAAALAAGTGTAAAALAAANAASTAATTAASSASTASTAVLADAGVTAAITIDNTAMTTAATPLSTAASATVTAATAASTNNSTTPVTFDVYDTQGNKYSLTGTISKNTTPANSWTFQPAATIVGSDGTTVVANVTGTKSTIKFNADGSLDTSTVFNSITIDPTSVIPASPYAGAGAFTVQPSGSAMTQYGSDTTAKIASTDGYAAGTLSGTTISSNGQIVGSFSNGLTQVIAQVALAVFNNPDGLLSAGGSLYTKTTNSGEPQIGATNTGGRGTLTAGSLEMSNVDLAQQFTNMIVAQRAFQADSKIITTDDSMLNELVQMKQ